MKKATQTGLKVRKYHCFSLKKKITNFYFNFTFCRVSRVKRPICKKVKETWMRAHNKIEFFFGGRGFLSDTMLENMVLGRELREKGNIAFDRVNKRGNKVITSNFYTS